MVYKNLAPFSDNRRMYGIHWELSANNQLDIWLESNPHVSEKEQIYISIGSVLAFQSIDESTALTLDNLRDDDFRSVSYGEGDYSVILEVTSPFWNDIRQLYPGKQLHHYHVVSLHYLLDILSEEEPIVRKLDKHEWRDFDSRESVV